MIRIENILSTEERNALIEALFSIRNKIQWKAGKDYAHLKKRQRMNHVSISATISDYDKIIYDIAQNDNNILYIYEFKACNYYAIRGFAQEKEWLIIYGPNGIMETAFPPEDTDGYLNKRGFVLIGQIKEVLQWTLNQKNYWTF